ncbi:MAG: ABC transporter substrate-binding protein [Myxococcota bacterium]|nr:ABC transporter substrate-binding protein [Myxococcota bacterium]
MRIHFLAALIGSFMALLAPTHAIAQEPDAAPPEETIPAEAADAARTAVDELYRALWKSVEGDPTPSIDERTALLEPTVAASYDLPFMAAKVLGRHWKSLDDEAKRRWLDVFARLTVHTYAERFDEDGGQEYEVGDVVSGGRDTLLVYSRILVPDEDPVEVNYRLHQRADRWGIVDVYLNGTVSELALRRSEYSGVLKRDGFEELVARLEAKIAGAPASAEDSAALN